MRREAVSSKIHETVFDVFVDWAQISLFSRNLLRPFLVQMEASDVHASPIVISRLCRAVLLQTPLEHLQVAVNDVQPKLTTHQCKKIVCGLQDKLVAAGFDRDALEHFDVQIGPLGSAACSELGMPPMSIKDRCVGSLVAVLIGDVLGAPYEGGGYLRAAHLSECLPEHFEITQHMGVEKSGYRYGMYTDDGNATLAVAESLAECGKLDLQDVANRMANSIFREPIRGCPYSAKAVAKAVCRGKDISKTGCLQFENGSFANGGAMKIAPIGLAYHNASADVLREASRLAVLSTHVHPEAVDGAQLACKRRFVMLIVLS